MKFDIKNRYTGKVQFTAEIEADENAPLSVKVGLAVRWGISSRANLRGTDLYGADLRWANLRGADLYGADLRGADLYRSDLYGANLRWSDLYGANLRWTNLCEANLREANLYGANLCGTNLCEADLRGTNLYEADLRVYQSGRHTALIQKENTRIGCQYHSNKEWRKFDDKKISTMAVDAVEWWAENKAIVFTIMDSLK